MAAIKNQSSVYVTEMKVQANIEDLASRAVSSAVDVFAIIDGQVSVPDDRCPIELLFLALQKISKAFELHVDPELDLNSRESLHRLLQANFDSDTQGFLEQDTTSEIFAHLTPTQKARILAQAIASTTLIFSRLAETHRTITHGLLNREAQLFAESDQRALMQEFIEESPVFERCELRSDITKAIKSAMEAEESPSTPQPVASDDNVDFVFSPNAGQERPKNMGLPWGFTIMSIN